MKNTTLRSSLLTATLVAFPFGLIAATSSFTVSFQTVQDLQINESNPISFGTAHVFGKTATTCTLTTAVDAGSTTSVGVIANSDILDSLSSGDGGCISITAGVGNNLSGVYEVTGVIGQDANVTISSATGGDFDFTPAGFMVSNDSTVDFSAPVNLVADNSALLTIGDGGSIVAVVGGVISINQDLTPNTPYSLSFDITAIY